MKSILSVIFISLFLCVTIKASSRQRVKTDPAFVRYVNSFYNDKAIYTGNKRRHNVPIFFGKTKKEVFGVCVVYTNNTRAVIINRKAWFKMPVLRRKALVYHEMAHCVLDRGHFNLEYNNWPASIMNKYLIDDEKFQLLHDYYIRELFTRDIRNFVKLIKTWDL